MGLAHRELQKSGPRNSAASTIISTAARMRRMRFDGLCIRMFAR
ncbi:hypothetical protein CEV34_4626 [Brucella pseudogrignonensis]|uniref:Uncharacterized protein n=1 Tax=Brucella pseudogrignonensis TaxID=419475 RepID=A0A256G4B4_9HYPH|nr:hypothetical protein CEV34_4626 [Brucella pseudogrignonensis]